MFIKYDEIELMEFFESEPIFIGDEEAGECMYCLLYTSPSPRD